MPESPSGGERSEPATPRRREEARKRGQVARSADLSGSLLLLVALILLFFLFPVFIGQMIDLLRYLFEISGETDVGSLAATQLYTNVMGSVARFFIPFFGVLFGVAMLVNAAQVGLYISGEPLTPKFEKLNPLSGFKRLFSLRSFIELAKSIGKLTVIGFVAYITLRQALPQFVGAGQQEPVQIAVLIGTTTFRVLLRCVLALLVIGVLDYAYQRYQYEQDIRMTKEEVRQETKDFEGDPQVRARIRRVRRQMAMQRMMAEVPTADVVVTNPTFLAIAVRYDMGTMSAPTVVAKGARLQAERIRDLATEHDVPIVENPPLAQALFKAVEVNEPVPSTLYKAVAEVLAFVYQIDKRARGKWSGLQPQGAGV